MATLEEISIHAPAKGSDKQAFNFLKVTHNFNPRSREGSDVPL